MILMWLKKGFLVFSNKLLMLDVSKILNNETKMFFDNFLILK